MGKAEADSIKPRGGTGFWFYYFQKNNLIQEFDYNSRYPLGTLLLRNYIDINDQGHCAVLYSYYDKDPSKLLYGNIIHVLYWSR